MGNHEIRVEVERFREHQQKVDELRRETTREESRRAEIEREIADRERERDAAQDDFIRQNRQAQVDRLKAELPEAEARIRDRAVELRDVLARVQAAGIGVVLGDRVLSPADLIAEANLAALDLQHPIDRALLAGQLDRSGFGILLRDPDTSRLAKDYLLDLHSRGNFVDARGEIVGDFLNGGEVFDAWLAGSIKREWRLVEHDMPPSEELALRIEELALAIPDTQPRSLYSWPSNNLLYLVADRLNSYVLALLKADTTDGTEKWPIFRFEWSAATFNRKTIDSISRVAGDYLDMVLRLEQRGRLESRLADPFDQSKLVELSEILATLEKPDDSLRQRRRALQLLALMEQSKIGLRAGPSRY